MSDEKRLDPSDQIIHPVTVIAAAMEKMAADRYPSKADAKASRGTLAIANLTDREVTYTVTPAEEKP